MANEKGSGNRFGYRQGVIPGILLGIILTFLYVKFGFKLPSWLQPVDNIKNSILTMVASLSANDNDLIQLQRAIAVRMRNPGYYTRIDNALGKFITEEILWREKTKRTLYLLLDKIKLMDTTLSRYDGLKRLIQPIRLTNLKKTNPLAYKYLIRRFPSLSEAEIIEKLKHISLTDLLQITYPTARILFTVPSLSSVRIDIFDTSGQKVKTLIDTELPAGKYRLYWDFTNGKGERLSDTDEYTYEIHVNGGLKRSGNMETPKAVFN